MKSDYDEVFTLLDTVHRLTNLARESKVKSLTEYTKGARIEPLTLIDSSLMNIDEETRQSILQTALSQYAGFYLQAVKISAGIGDVKVINILDKFATERDPLLGAATGWQNLTKIAQGLEAYDAIETNDLMAWAVPAMEDKNQGPLEKYSSLAVGKAMNVPVKIEKETFNVETILRIVPQVLSPEHAVNILALDADDNSMKGRYHRWRAGALSNRDYLLCTDIIEADKKGLITDETGLYKAKRNRKTKGVISTILSGQPSVNVASAITIITRSTAKRLEVAMRGKLSSVRAREDFFEDTMSMMLLVVDPQLEVVEGYYKGISESATFDFDDLLKNSTNPNGVDINSVLRAYRTGQAPGL